MLMAKKVVPSGPTIAERIATGALHRPTWDDFKKRAAVKSTGSSEYLEKWENDQFKEECNKERDLKRGKQERDHLREIRKQAKRKKKEDKREKRKRRDESDSSEESESKSSEILRREKKKRHRKTSAQDDSYRMSTFFRMAQEDTT